MEFRASDPKQPYRSLMRLASGGMGQVDVSVKVAGSFQRIYAVKRLRDELLHDDMARSMFLDEARLAGLVRHPNVVSVIDVGVDRRGPYLVMDFVEGLNCSGLLRKTRERAELLPVQFCLRIAYQVALGLHSAHELRDAQGQPLGLVHRDVSPQNILIGFDGVVRLTDFGIAKAMGRSTETTTHLLKGKMGYMSPEQLRFEEPDRRSDLFAFGVVLYELLSAQRLYREPSPSQTARRILNEAPPDIDDIRSDVPPSIVSLLFSLLAKSPNDRPPTARSVADTLDEAISDIVAGEGREDPEKYMRRHFEKEASDLRLRLDEAVIALTHADESRSRKRTLQVGVAGLVATALIAALVVGMTREGATSDIPISIAGAPAVSPEHTNESETPEGDNTRAVEAVSVAAPDEVTPSAERIETSDEASTAMSEAPASAMSRARRGRRRRAQRSTPTQENMQARTRRLIGWDR